MSDSADPGDAPSVSTVFTDSESWEQLKSVRDPASFAAAWLDIQCQIIDANVCLGVVVLGKEGEGELAPIAVWPVGSLGTPALAAAIESTIVKRHAVIHGGATSSRGEQQRNTIACPLLVDAKVCGAVAIEVDHCSEAQLQHVLGQLEWGAVWLETLVHRNKYTSADRLVTVLDLVATSLHYDRFQAAATAVATELAGILQCERVSIGFLHGKHSRVHALSHSASFGKKSNIIRDIGAAMDEAVDQEATVVFPPFDDGPLQVTRYHASLLKTHGAGAICSIPFTDGGKILGAITLERPEGEKFDRSAVKLCEHAASLLGPVLDSRRKDDRWLAIKALDSLKTHARKLVGPRYTALKLTAASTLFLLVFFTFATGEYRVTADATMEGAVQRAIAVPLAGFLAEANARAGDVVKAGDVLFSLDDRDLRLERLKWASQKSQYSREYSEAQAKRDRAQVNILGAQIEQAEAQIALVEEQLERINVTAPFDSFVVSGDLSQSLGAPVERGDILFEVAPLDSYRVILKVDERDIGQLMVAQSGQLALTGMPGVPLVIEVEKIIPVSAAEEGRSYFKVEARLLEKAHPTLRPGMQGVGKIFVGERKLIWIWTHKITHWWSMFLWSWWP
ncbi:HlyD family efflux transporter periplasmic adaptor subunit [Halieaceae bacterium IMCC14734]|uniref:HlyD family efflux transporter periplasmic adaptor subunit n=1 Tax=Candidatus Litorirhabdus singularis TaxID=2518993 RepID=A0ABT3TJY1_9GAMM|nr:HlyD family efflux transporter periplasmic adaptor subunit [Candidatus Litorirhabdus singularis]MCX2982599.1 HlyD family efflux transporter periplasmic adaptor subunit [Candidatus Litorirhabdus singularis]